MAITDTRGQAYTLEGVAAAGLVILGMLLAMQSIVITPTTEGAVDQDVTSQLGTEADDVLAAAQERGALTQAALFWDASEDEPIDEWGRSECPETEDGIDLSLCTLLEETFSNRFYQYNVYIDHQVAGSSFQTESEPMFDEGAPGDSAAVATRSVALYRESTLSGHADDPPTLGEVEDDSSMDFYADNMTRDEHIHNVVEIRVVVW